MTDHGIVAADWQLKAADRLTKIILPLVPKPTFDGYLWCWNLENKNFPCMKVWATDLPFDAFDLLPYQIGDRIYLKEEWCKGDWGAVFEDDIYFTKSSTPEAENIGWQPAETMPHEAAQYWYEVTAIRVVQARNLTYATMDSTGIYAAYPGVDYPGRESVAVWDATYPESPWDSDRHVVVLSVQPAV
jgi:hypothetical protein